MKYISMYKLDVSLTILMQQIKALLQNIGTTFCPDLLDWFGVDTAGAHSRNADQSVLTKFLQANPSDYSTTKLKVRLSQASLSLILIVFAHSLLSLQLLLYGFIFCNFLIFYCYFLCMPQLSLSGIAWRLIAYCIWHVIFAFIFLIRHCPIAIIAFWASLL